MAHSNSRFREIVRSSLKVGVSTIAGLVGWMVGGKILALELGAAGVGLFGLLRQLLQNLTLISTFNGTTALVQGVATRAGGDRDRYTRNVARLFGAGGGAVAIALLVGAPWLGPWLVPHPDAVALLRWMALAVIATTAQTFFVGLLNGNRAIDALVRCQMLGPLAVILTAYPTAILVRRGQPAGIVLLLLVPGALVALAAWLAARRGEWFKPAGRGVDSADARSFFGTSAVLLVTGFLGTGSQFLQNRLVAGTLGLEQAGLFWAAWTLSMAYVTILLGSYGTYYMPALSSLKDRAERRSLIRDYLRLALLVMPVLVSLVVVVKPWVLLLMFSPKLLPAVKVMRWMLIGDFFKGVAWVLSFPMLAFNEMRWFFWTELAFTAALAAGSWIWIAAGGGTEGLGVLFLGLYVVYALGMWGYARARHQLRLGSAEVLAFGAGLALVLVISSLTWSDETVRGTSVAAFLALSPSFLLFASRLFRSRSDAESTPSTPSCCSLSADRAPERSNWSPRA